MSWSISELRVRLAPLNRFNPSSKIFYWPFQGGTSFVDLLCFCSVLCLLCLCARLFICALWSPAGKGLTSWLLFVVSTVSLSLSHLYPGSGMVLDCIDSWSLHPYLLCLLSLWKMPSVTFLLENMPSATYPYERWLLSLILMKFAFCRLSLWCMQPVTYPYEKWLLSLNFWKYSIWTYPYKKDFCHLSITYP